MFSCHYKGHKEKCLLKGGRFPVTKNGKISKKRIRSADAYGSKMGLLSKLKKGGLCSIAKKHKIKVKSCMGKK